MIVVPVRQGVVIRREAAADDGARARHGEGGAFRAVFRDDAAGHGELPVEREEPAPALPARREARGEVAPHHRPGCGEGRVEQVEPAPRARLVALHHAIDHDGAGLPRQGHLSHWGYTCF